ncbi:gamma-secretase subunit Aph-1 [Ischnura elegans]|uniref:gamma-secretase subunit Aph-1 n=1 Tax=Ischnura elegans TaxID=197161 RepID=UPI001ED89508|nr:gamma-secretase subunit Aph-1 [Ischnura elegans]
MTLMEFFGCTFIAFGPPLAMFTFTIAKDPIRIIILIASAFFWLLSLLLSSILWFLVIPLKSYLAFGLVFSVLFQELFRFLIYKLLCKAEMGLRRVTDAGTHASNSKHVLAYVSGLGFGVMSGAFSLVNVLADAIGPATMGLRDGTDMFFVTSAATSLCIILLHTFWGVIFFSAVDKNNYLQLLWVLGSHMLVSCLTLLNRRELYFATLIPAYIVMVITAVIAYVVVGGTLSSFKEALKFRRTTLVVTE